MALLRSILFYTGQILLVIFFVTLSLLLPVPYRYRYAFINRWSRSVLWWLKVTCRLDYRVIGQENIPQGAVVVLSKHQSAFETIALQQIFSTQTWVLKRELLWIPVFGWGLILMRAIAIDRKAGKKALRQVIDQGTQRLHDGISVVIFPEGTRTAPGERKPYAIGGAMLAEKSGYPIVPVAHNAGEFWPRQSILKKPGTVTFVIGEPIDTQGKKAGALNKQVEEWIESQVEALSSRSPEHASD